MRIACEHRQQSKLSCPVPPDSLSPVPQRPYLPCLRLWPHGRRWQPCNEMRWHLLQGDHDLPRAVPLWQRQATQLCTSVGHRTLTLSRDADNCVAVNASITLCLHVIDNNIFRQIIGAFATLQCLSNTSATVANKQLARLGNERYSDKAPGTGFDNGGESVRNGFHLFPF
ncbi:hypothetical protein [Caudoviricetes sp.]|nr:hypothetical protein [Caudoviricetes sp.]